MTSMSKYLFQRNLRFSKCLRSRVHLKEFYKIRFIRFGGVVIGGAFCFWAYYISKSHIYCNEEIHKYKQAIDKSWDLLRSLKDEVGAPGIVVGVSVDGNTVWKGGLGYSDVENRVLCTENTVMRIASISKSITMAAVAKLWEDGKLDFDKPVQEYVPSFPEKTYEGEKVSITCRHLVSHLSGIRHYDKNILKEQDNSEKMTKEEKEKKNKQRKSNDNQTEKSEETKNQKNEFDLKEYYIKNKFDNLEMSLNLFKEDPLAHKPGTKFLYTTHGWTLISAIVEAVVKEPFEKYMCKLFKEFGMMNTYLDVNDKIIYHRSRYYYKGKNGNLQNSPYVDNSYKWAGGGFLSTIGDLLKFGNIMLYSFQYKGKKQDKLTGDIQFDGAIEDSTLAKTNPLLPNGSEAEEKKVQNKPKKTESVVEENKQMDTVQYRLPGYLKHETVKMLWSPVENTSYGMGWQILSHKQCYGYCKEEIFNALHTGGAVGASSVLLILPRNCKSSSDVSECNWECPPQGIVIAIVTNLQSVNLSNVAVKIAKLFEESSI